MFNAVTEKTQQFLERSKKNLGTFSSCHLEKGVKEIFSQYMTINAVDNFTYPELKDIETDCKHFFLKLTNAKQSESYHTLSTSGSSESILISLIHLKKNHQKKVGKGSQLNVILADNTHVAWRKAAKYLDIDVITLPLDRQTLQPDYRRLEEICNTHTIGVIASCGNPLTMLFDDINILNQALEYVYQQTNLWLPIHIDSASGAFLNYYQFPEQHNDFRSNHVLSINISSHKFGFLPPSMGWCVIKETQALEEMMDGSEYVGCKLKRASIQYSHSAAYLLAQHYVINQLGELKFKEEIEHLCATSNYLIQHLSKTGGNLKLITAQDALPGCVFELPKNEMLALSKRLQDVGWSLPVYDLPLLHSRDKKVARIVIKHGFDKQLVDELLTLVIEAGQHRVLQK